LPTSVVDMYAMQHSLQEGAMDVLVMLEENPEDSP
jgi:hypothetical protein